MRSRPMQLVVPLFILLVGCGGRSTDPAPSAGAAGRGAGGAGASGGASAAGGGGGTTSSGGSSNPGGGAGVGGDGGSTTGASGAGNGGASSGGASGNGGSAGGGGVSGNGGMGGEGGPAGSSGTSGNGGSAGRSGAAGNGGCTTPGTGGTSGAAGAGGTSADSGVVTCSADSDCPPVSGSPCAESVCVMGSGAHRCETRVHPRLDVCPPGDAGPFCCTDDAQCNDSPHGHCVPYSYAPECTQSAQAVPIPPPLPGNHCVYDECASDLDCQVKPSFCSAGFPRACTASPCTTNSDCNRRAGGQCVLAVICEWGAYQTAFCRYADDPCRSNADCKSDASGQVVCAPNDDRQGTVCKNIGVPPP